MHKKTKVMVSSPYYLPGYKAGGALRTVVNMVGQLDKNIDFLIITRDRDAFMEVPYTDIPVEKWLSTDNAQTFYIDKNKLTLKYWCNLLNKTNYDVLYLNSYFSVWFSIMPLILARVGMLNNSNIILAPRGEFGGGALALKSYKKRLYLYFAKVLGVHKNILFQASSAYELDDIKRVIGSCARVEIAADLPAKAPENIVYDRVKLPEQLRLCFLARIAPVKNLDGALIAIKAFDKPCTLNIFGPIDDSVYWCNCQQIIAGLPGYIRVIYNGEVENSRLGDIFLDNDFLFLPTFGENFGHVIYESLSYGCPVIISDKTPWRNLSCNGVGWDVEFGNTNALHDVLNYCYELTDSEYKEMRGKAREYSIKHVVESDAINDNYRLLKIFEPG